MSFQLAATILFSTLVLIPISLKLAASNIFSNIEFKTRTYKYLRLNSIVDSIFLIAILFLPFMEYQEECSYWFILFKLYCGLYLSKSLKLVNVIISLIIAWNSYKDWNGSKINGKFRFYLILCVIIMLALVINSPSLFIYKISQKSANSTPKLFSLEHVNENTSKKMNIFQYLVTFFILGLAWYLTASVVYAIRKCKKLRYLSILYIARNNSGLARSRSSIAVHRLESMQSAQKLLLKIYESKSKKFTISITFAFLADQTLMTLGDIIERFFFQTKTQMPVFISVFYLTIIISQIVHVAIYYRFNESFAKRFKMLLKRYKKERLYSETENSNNINKFLSHASKRRANL